MSPAFTQVKNKFRQSSLIRDEKVDIHAKKIKRRNACLLLTVLVLGVWYLAQINVLATKGYTMKGLEKQIAALQKESKRLELEVAKDSSLDAVKGRIASLGMVRSDQIEYIESDHPVAIAK